MSLKDFFKRLNRLKARRDAETHPQRKKILQNQIDRLLDERNAQLDRAIMEIAIRLEEKLDIIIEEYAS
jgi:hypothetical protein